MTAIALLHPDVPARAVKPFQQISPELKIRPDLGCAEDLQAAIIFGGDGTVHRHLAELRQRRIPALVVPAGSGNDFAKALGMKSLKVALAGWKAFCAGKNNVREIDLGVVRTVDAETLFCCVAGAGLDAESNARANRLPFWLRARGGYLLAALWSLARAKPVVMTLKFQSPALDAANLNYVPGAAWLVAVGNANRYGSGIKIVPEARLDDGLLDVCVVSSMRKLKLSCALPSVFWGGHVRLKEVQYFRATRVWLDSAPAVEIYADGEPVSHTPAEFSTLARALKVIVPV